MLGKGTRREEGYIRRAPSNCSKRWGGRKREIGREETRGEGEDCIKLGEQGGGYRCTSKQFFS
jgi:hypothetical protein